MFYIIGDPLDKSSVADPWHFGTDPGLLLMDPDPTIFVIDFQDVTKTISKFFSLLLFEDTFA